MGDPELDDGRGRRGSATLLTELGAVQAVEQRIAALTGSALDALARRARSPSPPPRELAELAVTATRRRR